MFCQEAEGVSEKHSQNGLLWFPWKRQEKAGWEGLGLANLNSNGP